MEDENRARNLLSAVRTFNLAEMQSEGKQSFGCEGQYLSNALLKPKP